MRSRGIGLTTALFAGTLVVLASSPAVGAGFGIFEHGSKAMGMASAFTAQADDPSAMFYNAAGLAFQNQRAFELGTTLITADSTFTGQAPYPGPTATGEQENSVFYPSHAYYVQPLTAGWTFGLGFNSPFGLTTEWKNPDDWAGKFIATKTVLRTFDLNPTIAWQATPDLGIGFGVVARWSDLELNRHIGAFNPITGQFTDVGKAHLTSDLDTGYGFNLGILNKINPRFSWGLSYRSRISIDYKGDGRFSQTLTGIAPFDAGVAAQVPFDQDLPIKTSIDFPDLASLGFAFGLTPSLTLETDINWTGWSSFDKVDLTFPNNPAFSQTIEEKYDDAFNYRAGLNWVTSPTTQWRFGAVYDETPQPEPSAGPLLPDANRTGLSIGYGYTGGAKFDVAFMYLPFADRTRNEEFAGDAVFHGKFETTAYLLGLSVGF